MSSEQIASASSAIAVAAAAAPFVNGWIERSRDSSTSSQETGAPQRHSLFDYIEWKTIRKSIYFSVIHSLLRFRTSSSLLHAQPPLRLTASVPKCREVRQEISIIWTHSIIHAQRCEANAETCINDIEMVRSSNGASHCGRRCHWIYRRPSAISPQTNGGHKAQQANGIMHTLIKTFSHGAIVGVWAAVCLNT